MHNIISYTGAIAVYGWFAPSMDLASVLWMLHFGRRALESLLLFDFSQAEVLVADSVQEFVYYWGFAYWISISVSVAPDAAICLAGTVAWAGAEYANYRCHCTLAKQAPKKKKGWPVKKIKRGAFLFELLTCPHYFFEVHFKFPSYPDHFEVDEQLLLIEWN